MITKSRLFSMIVYIVIFAYSIQTYTDLYYIKELDMVSSVLCFLLQLFVYVTTYWTIVYLWQSFLKDNVIKIISYFFPTFTHNVLGLAESEKSGDSRTFKNKGICNDVQTENVADDITCIENQYSFVAHYIGDFLSPEQSSTLKNNINRLAYEEVLDETSFTPVSNDRFGKYNLKDISHLCHAIGNHTLKRRSTHEIATFLKICFPAYCMNYDIRTLERKLTDTDYNNILIPVIKKYQQLPDYRE